MKNIGFLICGVGNGHLTQAKTIYQILRKNGYNIPIIISCGRNRKPEWKEVFKESEYINEVFYVSEKETNDLESISSHFNYIISILKPFNANYYQEKYSLDMFINFWTPSLTTTFPVPCLSIAYQYNITGNILLDYTIKLCKNKQVPISIGQPNKYSPYYIPSLISNKLISKEKSEKNICLAYAVSGTDFIDILIQIAINNSDFEIHFFYYQKIEYYLPENIILHNVSRKDFQELLKKTDCVLCTSGNELIQECVLNSIPVATMPCSESQFEQKSNCDNYVNNLKYAVEMNSDIKLNELSLRDMTPYQTNISESLRDRDKKIINLIEQFINN